MENMTNERKQHKKTQTRDKHIDKITKHTKTAMCKNKTSPRKKKI